MMQCRFCDNPLKHEFIDLINAPPSNSFLSIDQLEQPEIFYPLKLFVCDSCWLVQIDEYKNAEEIFSNDYAYFSSYSKSWLQHAENYVEMITEKLHLTESSMVMEIASNDGYILQYFKKKHVPCVGIEPTESTAKVARDKGISIISEFFGCDLAKKLKRDGYSPNLILGNNVLAHVPDINDFVEGLSILLPPNGIITMEFPHLMQLIEKNQFDTIYHEHYSYFSLHTVESIFNKFNLVLFDVEELKTHGGSLRIYAKHRSHSAWNTTPAIGALKKEEIDRGMLDIKFYKKFQNAADKIKYSLVSFLIEKKHQGKKIVAYGAAAKGNTLLNYCGIKKDLISFVVDASPHKQGKYLPGVHIHVVAEKILKKFQPDFVLILPWNITEEIAKQLSYIKKWDGQFIVPIPKLKVF